jgi:DNA-binding MarR family transcriptional regulator
VSRNPLDIGERNRYMEEGFGLVAARNNPMNLREKEYYLTDKGRALLHSSELASMSARAAAAELNARKIETPSGAPWSAKTVIRARARVGFSAQ